MSGLRRSADRSCRVRRWFALLSSCCPVLCMRAVGPERLERSARGEVHCCGRGIDGGALVRRGSCRDTWTISRARTGQDSPQHTGPSAVPQTHRTEADAAVSNARTGNAGEKCGITSLHRASVCAPALPVLRPPRSPPIMHELLAAPTPPTVAADLTLHARREANVEPRASCALAAAHPPLRCLD